MGKKSNKNQEQVVDLTNAGPKDCGVIFDSSDAVLDEARKMVRLDHVSKPWTRESWEKARPFILEQRQKLETTGWAGADSARTEMYVLRRNAPHGAFTDDGFMYIRIPKKFIDFHRSSRPAEEDKADEHDEGKQRKTLRRRKENAPSYKLDNEFIWKVRVDGDGENSDRDPNVILDTPEPLENIFYLVQCLSPGMARLEYNRKDAMQPNTKQSDLRDDPEAPAMRHRAVFAASEKMVRTLPPVFWLKKNETELRKILGAEAYEATMRAAQDDKRSHIRDVKGLNEKVWEEALPPPAPLALARIPPVLVESLSRAVARSPYQAPFLSAFGSASENGYARKPISIGPVETGTVLSWMTAALAVGASALFFRPFV
ncbi:uncharacterized protein UMAG_04014 [Mycosarcoma maydis]|uniref:Uncharacterized protein n=1 Tax=Mycosarcoma maydis TaxID=5270 RepID=A0A0D1CMQ3_MYCMD|nr:uncharacterized protein UMAG_04014 [Ustilago maydis 521]KIS67968.1 hypothetical protein UMAG_04014 [Ustilago maydis 521]|eukprot:XP_011390463.1 hypothetical protein UMAG_04014 [Ustilago maydis 521]